MSIDKQVRSSLQEELNSLLDEATNKRQERREELQQQVNEKHYELATLDDIPNLTTKQKVEFMYSVKPHLIDIGEMLTRGATKNQIAKSLGVSYRALVAMIENVPELEEVFHTADMEMIDLAETSMRYLANHRVTEKQEVDRFGNVQTIQEYKEPDFRAVRFILERRDPRYSDKKVVEHKATISEELEDILKQFSVDDIKTLEKEMNENNIIDAEFEDVE